jgi:hypothetical protein
MIYKTLGINFNPSIYKMKYVLLVLLCAITSIAAGQSMKTNLDKKFDAALATLNKGKTKDAIKGLQELQILATKNKDDQSLVLATLLLQEIVPTVEETKPLKAIEQLQILEQRVEQPFKQIVNFHIAKAYIKLYNEERRYNEISATVVEDLATPSTWSRETYYDKFDSAIKKSLSNPQLLAATKIKDVNKLFMTYANEQTIAAEEKLTNILVPNLYYTLVHNIVQLYSQKNFELVTNTNSYDHSKYDGMQDLEKFVAKDWKSQDKYSDNLNGLKLFQGALQIEKTNTEAKAYLDFKRIQFANSLNDDEQNLNYEQALIEISKKYTGLLAGDIAKYYLAQMYQSDDDNDSQPTITPNNERALKLCNEIITANRNQILVEAATTITNKIKEAKITATTEHVVTPNSNFIALLTYKNLQLAKVSIYQINNNNQESLRDKPTLLEKSSRLIYSSNFNLVQVQDYKTTQTEIELPMLAIGHYLIKIESVDGKTFCRNLVQVSNLQIVYCDIANKKHLAVIDRTKGDVLSEVKYTLQKNLWNNAKRKYENKVVIADKIKGITLLPNLNYETIKVQYGNDILNQDLYHYTHNSEPTVKNITTLYTTLTDRAIYRPGQTVQYKVIACREQSVLSENTEVTVICRDANGQEITKQELKLNSFGSASGSFTLPSSTLNGSFNFSVDNNYTASFKVEEYKRPKFEVIFDSIKTAHKLDDVIKLQGKAIAYNGTAITNAKVNYSIQRAVNYPYRWCWWPGLKNDAQMQIANGSTVTNDKGEFTIEYTATSQGIKEQGFPIFSFRCTAVVTDANGETHEAEQSIKLNKQGFVIKAIQLNKSEKDKLIEIRANVTNLENIPQNEKLKLSIYELEMPENIRKERLWAIPKQTNIDSTHFFTTLAHEDHLSKTPSNTTKILSQVLQQQIIESNTDVNIQNYLKKSGAYKIVIEHASGLKDEEYIFNYAGQKLLPYELFDSEIDKAAIQINKKIPLSIYCNADGVSALIQYNNTDMEVLVKSVVLQKGTNTIELPALNTKNTKGAYEIEIVYHNRVYFSSGNIEIPISENKNNLKLITFRNKILPGSKQEWTLGLQKGKADTKEFEVLANMYDASLDEFAKLYWHGLPKEEVAWPYLNWSSEACRAENSMDQNSSKFIFNDIPRIIHPSAIEPSNYLWGTPRRMEISNSLWISNNVEIAILGNANNIGSVAAEAAPVPTAAFAPPSPARDEQVQSGNDAPNKKKAQPSIRTNLQESAFFLPHLQADKDGKYIIKFTAPEALTKWRLMCYAHNTDLQEVFLEDYTVTQKELMVVPNLPRFLRNGDAINILAKINNLSATALSGNAQIQILDAATEQDITQKYCKQSNATFNVNANGNTQVSFPLNVDLITNAPIIIRILASSGTHSDGEQVIVPVLSNKILVTESLPILLKANQQKEYTLKSLTKNTESIQPVRLNIQTTNNPMWYAVQALPYLAEYNFDCTEQLFSKWYAYKIAEHIGTQNPQLRELSKQWLQDSNALKSNLQKNDVLKQIVLSETPWVQAASNETQQKISIAKVFAQAENKSAMDELINKLKARQHATGGFSWWPNMNDNDYITINILNGFAKLQALQALTQFDQQVNDLIVNALKYCDSKFLKRYEDLTKLDKKNIFAEGELQYLSMRTYFAKNYEPNVQVSKAIDFYLDKIESQYGSYNIYNKSMAAKALHQYGNTSAAKKVAEAIVQNITNTDDRGGYFLPKIKSWYWQDNKIDEQANVIETLDLLGYKQKDLEQLQLWLLLNKQSNYWSNTKSTADVVYALLVGNKIGANTKAITNIKLGGNDINKLPYTSKTNDASGINTFDFTGDAINTKMANISAKNEGKQIAWGSATLQYLAPIAEIQSQTEQDNAINIKKTIYKITQSDKGELLVESKGKLHVGDKVRIRLSFSTNREMDYVHIKDLRSACLEPKDVISTYEYKNGVGYYQVTKDVSTNYFIENLQKGNYILEYDAYVNSSGTYNEGLASIQCMYAPEFVSHSQGGIIEVQR